MRVSQLIDHLKSMPHQNALVLVVGYEGGAVELTADLIRSGFAAKNVSSVHDDHGPHRFCKDRQEAAEYRRCSDPDKSYEVEPAVLLDRDPEGGFNG